MCELNGWDFDAVKLGPVTDGSGALDRSSVLGAGDGAGA
jgi:hypothetical protein